MSDIIQSISIWSFKKLKESKMRNLNVSILCIYRTCKYIWSEAQICILFILALLLFSHLVFQWKPATKKIVKVIEDDFYDKLLQIYKGSETFVLAKFDSDVDKKICRLISNKNVKAKDKTNIVTGQTEFRLEGWSFIKQYFFENFQSNRSQIFCKIVLLNIS